MRLTSIHGSVIQNARWKVVRTMAMQRNGIFKFNQHEGVMPRYFIEYSFSPKPCVFLMGIRLIILLALLVGVLYSLHLLVKDYQALSAGSRLIRMLFKRDLSSQNNMKPAVRWKRILRHDPIQCARYLYCDIGARQLNNEVRHGLAYMLMLDPNDEDKLAHTAFKEAFQLGQTTPNQCRAKYFTCPFNASTLFEVIVYLLRNPDG